MKFKPGAGRRRKLRLKKSRHRVRARGKNPKQFSATLGRRRSRRLKGR